MKRNTNEIRAWLFRHGKKVADLAHKAGVSRPLASRTIHGNANNRKVLRVLVEWGVPGKYLALPKSFKAEELS